VRIAVVSDVHSNLAALDAVLKHADAAGASDGIWCAGDIVGYGPDPSATLARLRSRHLVAVAGNHDLAASGRMDVDEFNPLAAAAVQWTASELAEEELSYLAALPLVHVEGDVTIVHGSLRHPEWEYLLTPEQAEAHLELQTTPYSVIGHSHIPFWCEEDSIAPVFHRGMDGDVVELGDTRLIVNPGGLGQPRDGDPRASYIVYDDTAATMTYHRVAYDVAATQSRLQQTSLHPWLADRLAAGK
jgi:predicted phosphodiesterase